jgi:hypothetical protein
MTRSGNRRVTANLSLTLDGRYNGPGGPGDLGAMVPYAVVRGRLAHREIGKLGEIALVYDRAR